MLRTASYRIHQSLVEKPLSPDDFWPIEGIEKQETIPAIANADLINLIKKTHNYNG